MHSTLPPKNLPTHCQPMEPKLAFLSRKNRYPGTKLVVAIDIGTTNTAASYCLLGNDGIPSKFQEVCCPHAV